MLVQRTNVVSLFSLWKVIAPREGPWGEPRSLGTTVSVPWERGPSLQSSQCVALDVRLPWKNSCCSNHMCISQIYSLLLIQISIHNNNSKDVKVAVVSFSDLPGAPHPCVLPSLPHLFLCQGSAAPVCASKCTFFIFIFFHSLCCSVGRKAVTQIASQVFGKYRTQINQGFLFLFIYFGLDLRSKVKWLGWCLRMYLRSKLG